jgi:hypothetical protein
VVADAVTYIRNTGAMPRLPAATPVDIQNSHRSAVFRVSIGSAPAVVAPGGCCPSYTCRKASHVGEEQDPTRSMVGRAPGRGGCPWNQGTRTHSE